MNMKKAVEQPSHYVDTAVVATVSREPFFHRSDWCAFWVACILSFAVYFGCLPPSVTLEDSGEPCTA
ncbi:MAG: hypothetical protein N2255_07105, partial [Kiritimatiellae bacterium]|nr:hypothetical protein [Kiritimatiellia bacterium]